MYSSFSFKDICKSFQLIWEKMITHSNVAQNRCLLKIKKDSTKLSKKKKKTFLVISLLFLISRIFIIVVLTEMCFSLPQVHSISMWWVGVENFAFKKFSFWY